MVRIGVVLPGYSESRTSATLPGRLQETMAGTTKEPADITVNGKVIPVTDSVKALTGLISLEVEQL